MINHDERFIVITHKISHIKYDKFLILHLLIFLLNSLKKKYYIYTYNLIKKL